MASPTADRTSRVLTSDEFKIEFKRSLEAGVIPRNYVEPFLNELRVIAFSVKRKESTQTKSKKEKPEKDKKPNKESKPDPVLTGLNKALKLDFQGKQFQSIAKAKEFFEANPKERTKLVQSWISKIKIGDEIKKENVSTFLTQHFKLDEMESKKSPPWFPYLFGSKATAMNPGESEEENLFKDTTPEKTLKSPEEEPTTTFEMTVDEGGLLEHYPDKVFPNMGAELEETYKWFIKNKPSRVSAQGDTQLYVSKAFKKVLEKKKVYKTLLCDIIGQREIEIPLFKELLLDLVGSGPTLSYRKEIKDFMATSTFDDLSEASIESAEEFVTDHIENFSSETGTNHVYPELLVLGLLESLTN